MKDTLVVITYISGESQGTELELAVAGWRKHFKSPHKIVVIGDTPPPKVLPDCWLQMDRVPEKPGEYRPHLDICRKLEAICFLYADQYPGFIWASDDCYAVNDFTLEDVMLPKYSDEEMPAVGQNHFNPWWRNLVKTRKLCEKEGYGVVNWVTHLPLYFRFSDIIRCIWKFGLTENSYVLENIVFNAYKQEGSPVKLCREDDWKFSCFHPHLDREGFYDALAHKKWVCNSVNGWCNALENELRKHYDL